MIQINPSGFGGSNAFVIHDDTYYFFETISRYGHYRTVEAPFAANAAGLPDTDADCQESHAIAAGIGAKKVLESTPKLLVLSDQDGVRLLSASFQEFREIKGEGFATSRSMI